MPVSIQEHFFLPAQSLERNVPSMRGTFLENSIHVGLEGIGTMLGNAFPTNQWFPSTTSFYSHVKEPSKSPNMTKEPDLTPTLFCTSLLPETTAVFADGCPPHPCQC